MIAIYVYYSTCLDVPLVDYTICTFRICVSEILICTDISGEPTLDPEIIFQRKIEPRGGRRSLLFATVLPTENFLSGGTLLTMLTFIVMRRDEKIDPARMQLENLWWRGENLPGIQVQRYLQLPANKKRFLVGNGCQRHQYIILIHTLKMNDDWTMNFRQNSSVNRQDSLNQSGDQDIARVSDAHRW